MSNVESVKVLDGIENLIKNSPRSPFLQSDLIRHDFKKLSLLCIFGDNINKVSSLNDLIEVHNVGMSDLLHNLNLALNSHFVVFVLNCLFVNDLDGYLLTGGDVHGLLDLAKSAFAECLA
jgi:hypothetical protein